jgi:type IV pilus assembly protein PilQ
VEASSSFEKALGNKLGGAYTRSGMRAGGTAGSGPTVVAPVGEGSSITADTAALSAAGSGGADNIVNFNAIGATSGIGILRETTSGVLKVQLEALQKEGLNKIISNPKLFSLNNQAASITQGVQIQVPGSGDSPVTFKDAALKLQVTPNIIGDGNVLLDVQVNNDTPDRTNPGAVGINTMEINTKLLVADGDIVVIGGIKKNDISNATESVPGINKLPIVGKLFQGKTNSDTMSELLVFIAPRVL